MQIVTVYHVKPDMLREAQKRGLCFSMPSTELTSLAMQAFVDGLYEPVAKLTTENGAAMLDAAFALTQNVDKSWTSLRPQGLAPVNGAKECRSTMVGDMFEVSAGGRVLSRYVVDWDGFKTLPALRV